MDLLSRFSGYLEPFVAINPTSMVEWIKSISFDEWPQQRNPASAPWMPAMLTNHTWHNFGDYVKPIETELMVHFPGCRAEQQMLSVVIPGEHIWPHRDQQPPEWICRIHVPLITNDKAFMIMDDGSHNMEVGMSYRINTLATHAIRNDGDIPRIHFMMDVRSK